MGLQLDNLFGAVTNVVAAYSDVTTPAQFIDNYHKFGIQVKNNFEVNFSGLEEASFFIQSINLPGISQRFTQVHFNGRAVDIPICHEYEHQFSMTVLNDAKGYIYSALTNFIMSDSSNVLMNSGYTLVLRAMTGAEKNWEGMNITINGARFESIGGLDFGHDSNSIQTFTVNGKLIDYTVTPGALTKASGIVGAVSQLIG